MSRRLSDLTPEQAEVQRAANSARYQANKERHGEAVRAWRAANPDKVRDARYRSYEKNQRRPGQARRPRGTPEERFWPKVDSSGGPEACWPWTANRNWRGYGLFRVGGRGSSQVGAHRFSLELALGRPLAPGMQARHVVCDNPPCCNAAHLAEGTVQDNSDDMVAHERAATGERHSSRTRPDRVVRGERHPRTKLTTALVLEIRQRSADGEMQASVARSLGLTESIVSRVCRRQTWGHVA